MYVVPGRDGTFGESRTNPYCDSSARWVLTLQAKRTKQAAESAKMDEAKAAGKYLFAENTR
jgi:hypothetical protein